jgi:diguanylate cyclase (GGDEF)-like protein
MARGLASRLRKSCENEPVDWREIDQTETALRESEQALRLQATTDSLTGLYNRRHFYKLAEMEVKKAVRYDRPLSMIMYDIDFFKRINDTYGHPVGDEVIKMVADSTVKELRVVDISARYGGEEFIVLLPETPGKNGIVVAERLRKTIEATTVLANEQAISVTASFGVSDFCARGNEKSYETVLTEFIASADTALYTSKNSGRNQVTVFNKDGEA